MLSVLAAVAPTLAVRSNVWECIKRSILRLLVPCASFTKIVSFLYEADGTSQTMVRTATGTDLDFYFATP